MTNPKHLVKGDMNKDNLHALIDRYEENYYYLNGVGPNEKFKYYAVKGFRDIWFSEEARTIPFSQMFDEATKNSSIMINNRMITPTKGIVKMAEQRPKEVESLFRDLLFAPYGSIDELQKHMDEFLERIEEIRVELFPRYYRYKQERHAASCYLSFIAPQEHYIYRFSDAEEFAVHVEFEKDLGAGSWFKLANYYEMADEIVKALREHDSLLEKYEKLLKGNDAYYYDESLHIMAFDLMYCCRCYNFYGDMQYIPKKKNLETYTAEQLQEKARQERKAKIDEIDQRIRDLEIQMDQFQDISLIGVEVTQQEYGTGTVIEQDGSKITVRFAGKTMKYVINRKYSRRPRFEDDENIVDAFTELDELKAQKKHLETEKRILLR